MDIGARARAWRRITTAHPVIVNLKAGGAIRALALTPRGRGTLLELRKATVLAEDGSSTPADGVLIVPVEAIDYVQVI